MKKEASLPTITQITQTLLHPWFDDLDLGTRFCSKSAVAKKMAFLVNPKNPWPPKTQKRKTDCGCELRNSNLSRKIKIDANLPAAAITERATQCATLSHKDACNSPNLMPQAPCSGHDAHRHDDVMRIAPIDQSAAGLRQDPSCSNLQGFKEAKRVSKSLSLRV